MDDQDGGTEVVMDDAESVDAQDRGNDNLGELMAGGAELERLLQQQGHRARQCADGRIIIEPAPKPKTNGESATLGKTLQKLKVVSPLMSALEFQPKLQRLLSLRLALSMHA